jgi:hypothetical protein
LISLGGVAAAGFELGQPFRTHNASTRMGLSMADDNILRSYRSSDRTRRESAPAAPKEIGGSDPLAELARLIGQSDPFADLERQAPPRQRAESAPSDWRKTAAALARESMREPQPDPHYTEVDAAIAAARTLRAAPDDRFDQYSAHGTFDQTGHSDGGYADDHYADSRYADRAPARYLDDPDPASVADDENYDHHDTAQPVAHDSENYFFDGAPVPADERAYDDPPRARAANGLLTVLVLVGCGILGTAGAYGYRTYYSGAREADAPIISAEKTPNKMIPAGGEPQSGKAIQERVADNGGSEKVVPRQEEPITLTDPGSAPSGPNGPRVVLPAPFTPSQGPGPAVQSGAPGQIGSSNEPKKVHTVAIRPDGTTDPTARPVSSPNPPLQTAPAPVATRPAAPPPAARPVPPPPRNGAAPLSIDPQSQPVPADAASSYQPPTGATRLASVPPVAAAGGGYVVQVSSQRNEAEAQTSFRSLQAKFPSQLGDREAIVRRADLGPKGVYYRAMVGPFGSAADADQFCSGLKAAGGQCIVQKN